MGKNIQSSKKNILQHRQGAPKLCHPGAKVGTQAQRTMADFKKSLQNQVPAQINCGPQFCGPTAPKFDPAQRKEAVDKASFASMCGVKDTEYYSSGMPFVFDKAVQDAIQIKKDGTWYCHKHQLVLKSKIERLRHYRKEHGADQHTVSTRKNGQFKKEFSAKSKRSMKDRARSVYSDGEYQQILAETPSYIGDVPLIHRRCPSDGCGLEYPEHVTIQHFDMLKVDKITTQINTLMNQAGAEMQDRDQDDDDQTSEMQMLRAQFNAAMQLEEAVKQHTGSIVSECAAFMYSSDKESLVDVVLDGMHQVTPVFGVQFYQTYGGEIVDVDRSPDWQPDSVSQINFPVVGQADSVSHIVQQSEYYADVSDRRVSSNQSMFD